MCKKYCLTSRAVAVAPSIRAQKTRWILGGSGSPLELRQSMTREPESDDVTKYRMMANRENMERNWPMPG